MNLRSVTKWYHATTVEAAEQILKDGYIKFGNEYPCVFLANTKEGAGLFPLLRNNKNYAVFKIARRDLDVTLLGNNDAQQFSHFWQMMVPNMKTATYQNWIKVSNADIQYVTDNREVQLPPGVEIVFNGNKKIGVKIVDMPIFEHFCLTDPTVSKMIKHMETA